MKSLYLFLIFIFISFYLFSSYDATMDLFYKVVSSNGSNLVFKTINQEESGFGIDKLKFDYKNNGKEIYTYGSGFSSSYPQRFFHIKGKFENKMKFWANFEENIYYFNLPYYLYGLHPDKYSLKKLNFSGELWLKNDLSIFLNSYNNFKKGTSLRSNYFYGSILQQKRDIKFSTKDLETGIFLEKPSYNLRISQGIVFLNSKTKKSYLFDIDELSSPYISDLSGKEYEKGSENYPQTNLSFNLIKNKLRVISNFNYYNGNFKGTTKEDLFFNFGEEAQLISTYNLSSNYENKFKVFKSNLIFDYKIFPSLEFSNSTYYEKDNFESNIFANSLLVFTNPENSSTLELPYELVDSNKILIERFFNETKVYISPLYKLNLSFSYNINTRKIDEEVENFKTEHSFDFGINYDFKYLYFEGLYKKGDFSNSYFATEPLDFDGFYGKVNIKIFNNLSILGIYKSFSFDSEGGNFENKANGVGILFSKDDEYFGLNLTEEKINSSFPIDFGNYKESLYEYLGKNLYIYFAIRLDKDLRFEGFYSKMEEKNEIYPFIFINSSFKLTSSEIFKNMSPYFQVKYLSYENDKYHQFQTNGMVYIFGLNLRMEK